MAEIQKLEQETSLTVTKAKDFRILDQAMYAKAGEFLKAIKGLQKAVAETFNPIIEKAHQTHKEAIAQKDKHWEPLKEAERLIKEKMLAYSKDQERLRLAEMKKQEQAAEKKRQELEAQAIVARNNGNAKQAEKYEEKAAAIVAPIAEEPELRVEGIHTTERWYAEIIDEKQIPRPFLIPNMAALNKQAQATHDTVKVPGVVFKCEKTLCSRSA